MLFGLQRGGASSSVLVGQEGAHHPFHRPRARLWSWTLSVPALPWVGPAFSAWAASTWDSACQVPFQRPRPPLVAPQSPPVPAGPAGASTQVALVKKNSCHLAGNGGPLASSASAGRQHSSWGALCAPSWLIPALGLQGSAWEPVLPLSASGTGSWAGGGLEAVSVLRAQMGRLSVRDSRDPLAPNFRSL